MTTSETLCLPVGPRPDWELEDTTSDDAHTELHSVAQSFIVLQSLRLCACVWFLIKPHRFLTKQQARQRWLTSAFTKFSTRPCQGKQADIMPPPHTSITLGHCDIEIGPHTFHDTSLFEIQYTNATLPGAPSSQPSFQPSRSSTPSKPGPSDVTPTYLAQISDAALTNKELARLLQLAAANRATHEQIRQLGLIIQSIPPMAEPVPSANIDLVLEFRERPADRWIIPRHLAVCELKPLSQPTPDLGEILITVALFPHNLPGNTIPGQSSKPEVVKFRLTKTTPAMRRFVERWADPNKAAEHTRALDKLVSAT
jgi:hypothetical protein